MEKTGKIDDVARFEAEQDLVLDAQFLIQALLDERGMTRKEVARMLGVSSARLSQLMRADANPTLRTIAGIAHALGQPVTICRHKAAAMAGAEGNYSTNWDEAVLGWSDTHTRGKAARPGRFDFTALLDDTQYQTVGNDNHGRIDQRNNETQAVAA